MSRFNDKVAVGGSSGIGLATARRLIADGVAGTFAPFSCVRAARS